MKKENKEKQDKKNKKKPMTLAERWAAEADAGLKPEKANK